MIVCSIKPGPFKRFDELKRSTWIDDFPVWNVQERSILLTVEAVGLGPTWSRLERLNAVVPLTVYSKPVR